MKTTLKLLGAAAIMFGVSGATESFAGLLDNCQVYAQVSARQEQENQLSCKVKLTGDYWTTDLKKHIQYCQSVAPQKWKADLVARKEALEKCK